MATTFDPFDRLEEASKRRDAYVASAAKDVAALRSAGLSELDIGEWSTLRETLLSDLEPPYGLHDVDIVFERMGRIEHTAKEIFVNGQRGRFAVRYQQSVGVVQSLMQTLQYVLEDLHDGDYVTAKSTQLRLSMSLELGRMYSRGARMGITVAMINLAECFDRGDHGKPHDKVEAARLVTRAAATGDAESQAVLGMCLSRGCMGLPQSHLQAVEQYRLSAGQENPRAQYQLAKCYTTATGVEHSAPEAERLFTLAANQGCADSADELGYIYEMAGRRPDAMRWYKHASELGNWHGTAQLALCTIKCHGDSRNAQQEVYMLKSSSNTFYLSAKAHADEANQCGTPLQFTMNRVVRDLVLASNLGHAAADEELARIAERRDTVSACCLGCGATHRLRKCTACNVAAFCDRGCQVKMWPGHREHCRAWRAEDDGSVP